MRHSFLGILSIIATGLLVTLLLFGVLSPDDLVHGILGNADLQPWKILTIFFTVAYVAVSADQTGIFAFLAHRVIHLSHGDGKRLFLFFFLFAGAMTLVTSNDIVILTLTPIIFYLGRFAKVNVLPFLFAEFFAAHTMSMGLYTGDPTNIIVASTFGFGFLEFSQIMILPAIVATVSSYLLLRFRFRKDITGTFRELDRSDLIPSWPDAITSVVLLLGMLATLVASDFLPWEIWTITAFFALVTLLKDSLLAFAIRGRLTRTLRNIPWLILPFVACVFTFVQVFVDGSWMSPFSAALSLATGPKQAIALFGVLGVVFSNLINNQPATIFLTHALVHPSFDASLQTLRAGAFALVVASNLGATFTIMGAFAGIMWQKILREKDFSVSYRQFIKTTLAIALPVLILTLLSLTLVV